MEGKLDYRRKKIREKNSRRGLWDFVGDHLPVTVKKEIKKPMDRLARMMSSRDLDLAVFLPAMMPLTRMTI